MRFGKYLFLIFILYSARTDAAVTRQQQCSAQATSCTISAPTTGDLIVSFAHRDGSTTVPTLDANYTNIDAPTGNNTNSARLGFRVSTGAETTCGTWTNATSVSCIVYRGASGTGSWARDSASSLLVGYSPLNTGTTVTFSLGPQSLDGTSWYAAFAGHVSSDTDIATAAISGMTIETSATDVIAADTEAGITNWPRTIQTLTMGTSAGWRSYVVEIVCSCAASGYGVITFDSSSRSNTNSADPFSTALTVKSGAINTVVICDVSWFNTNASITGVTWNGTSMTQVWNALSTSTTIGNARFILANGTGDGVSHNCTATFGFTPLAGMVRASSWIGVDQTTIYRTPTGPTTFDSLANVPAVTLTATNAVSGDVVVDSLVDNKFAQVVSSTAIYQETTDTGGASRSSTFMSAKKATGSTTMAYTVDSIQTVSFLGLLPLIPASAPGGVVCGKRSLIGVGCE